MMPPPALKTSLRLLMTLALATGLSACASMPQKTPPPSNPTPVETPASTPETLTAQRAGQLTATGHDLAAAKDYIRAAAEARGQTQVHYLMEAAQASLKGRKPRVAILLANEVLRLQHDNAELRSAALWVRAQGFMDQGQTPSAKGNLEELLTITSTPQEVRAQAMGTLATLYTQEGHELTALNFLIEGDSLLSGNDAAENHRRIRALLDSQSTAKLQNWQGRSGNPLVQEWLAVALITRQNPDPQQRQAAISAWLTAHPGHPLINFSDHNATITDTSRLNPALGSICALLPSSGPYAPLSQAITAGMKTAAQLQSGPAVRALRTTGNPSYTAVLFERGIKEGCKVFVGPWLPQDINAVAAVRKPSDPPIITLGVVPGVQQSGLYTLSLSRNVAAQQIAVQSYGAGYRRAYVLYPQDSSGAAIQADFIATWKKLGGEVGGVATYLPGHTFTNEAQRLLSGSPGQDSFVFLVTNAKNANAAVSSIRLINNSVPIFSPALLHGAALPNDARGLSGIASVDMPWIINSGQSWPQAVLLLRSTLPNASDAQWRMAAFGLDAYRIAERVMDKDTTGSLAGATGTLHFVTRNQVIRDMEWMEVENGQIVPLSGVPKPGT
ncbi:putative Lipoprotein [Acidithiobacillus ferrivorans]|uniref:Lipoprotein n=1 Tax=Acidithiobacillus ferrivorans TaxID=160808 RepID=A0A060UXW6_9PROT|nr:penicillin-binding protein activator [Acidithiobacillus ferrivorans]CDQ11538.1 putative Lipoprotein [Acidithiobacillus ferrivorans]SMH66182.1 putative Lipoprotein [Acidithiobacillus ferrivorans]